MKTAVIYARYSSERQTELRIVSERSRVFIRIGNVLLIRILY